VRLPRAFIHGRERGLVEEEITAATQPAAEPSERLVAAAPAHDDQLEQTADLPIYRWFRNS
jgi:hypothetical protein